MSGPADGVDIDVERLAGWMREQVPDFEGPLVLERFPGGQSNPTYRIRTRSRDFVLRRRPFGPLLPGAHAVDREARVMAALAKADFPVPKVCGLCMDAGVIGSAFHVTQMVEGRIFWDARFDSLPLERRAACMDAMNATLAALHRIDHRAVGLGDLGRSGGYVTRQIARWSAQYEGDPEAGRDAAMDRLIDWLRRHVPADEAPTVIHGDYRVDNMIFDPVEDRVIAVLDWELCTLGHPLADFGYHAMMYRMPRDILGGIGGIDLQTLGLPDEAAYVEAYCRRTGRAGIPELDYYIAFNMFKFAAILHGIRGRVLRGTAANAGAPAMAALFERVAQLGWEQVTRSRAAKVQARPVREATATEEAGPA